MMSLSTFEGEKKTTKKCCQPVNQMTDRICDDGTTKIGETREKAANAIVSSTYPLVGKKIVEHRKKTRRKRADSSRRKDNTEGYIIQHS